jgi:hypothetical protein
MGHEAAVGVDQRLVQLTAPMLGLLPQIGTDDIVHHYLLRVVAVATDQSQLG